MNPEQEKLLSAYVDRELSPEDRADVVRLLAEDPTAGSFVEAMTRTNQLLVETYGSIVDEPVPDTVLPSQTKGWTTRITTFSLPLAAAASLVMAVVVGGYLVLNSTYRQDLNAIHAKLADLRDQTLELSPSGTPVSWSDEGERLNLTVVPLKTYRTTDNRYCRKYREVIKDRQGTEIRIGLACRSGRAIGMFVNHPVRKAQRIQLTLRKRPRCDAYDEKGGFTRSHSDWCPCCGMQHAITHRRNSK